LSTEALPYSETELVSRVAQGDVQAMRVLFGEFYPKLCFYAQSITGDAEQARDIAQDALVTCWQQRERFAGQRKQQLAAYLFTVVKRDCYDYQKRVQVRRDKQPEIAAMMEVPEEGIDSAMVYLEVLQQIHLEIEKLPTNLAEVVRLSFFEGLSTQEIADKLQMTPNNIRVQKSRALEKLKYALLKQQLLAPSAVILIFSEIFDGHL